jgi:hypothetical protein
LRGKGRKRLSKNEIEKRLKIKGRMEKGERRTEKEE